MDLTVGEEAHQVKRRSPLFDSIHGGNQNSILKKLPRRNIVINP
jgi:hypothetical protein